MFKTGGHQPTWRFSFSIILLWTTAGIPRWALKPWGPASHPDLASEIVGMDCTCFYGFYPKEAVSFPMAPAIIKSHSLHTKKKEKASSRTRCPIGMASPSLAILAELGVSTPPRSAFFVSSFFLLAFFCFFLRFFVFFVPCWLFFPDVSDVSLLFHILSFVGFCFSCCCFFLWVPWPFWRNAP